VNLAFGFLTYGPELSEQMMLFTVANPSHRPVQLTSIRLPVKNGGNMVFPHLEGEKRLPCMIEPGTSSKFWVQLADVEASIRGRDYTGSVKEGFGKPVDIALDRFVQSPRFDPVQCGEVRVEHDLLAANDVDVMLNRSLQTGWLGYSWHACGNG
jgi:hypothetical protein